MQSGTSTFACQRSLRLGLHVVQTRAPRACCSTMTRQCPHCLHHSGLAGSKLHAAGHPDPMFPGLSPLTFLSAPSSEAAAEEEVASGYQRCLSLFQGRDFWQASVNMVWHRDHLVWKDDQVRAVWEGNWARQEICRCATSRNLWDYPGTNVLYFSLSEISLYTGQCTV